MSLLSYSLAAAVVMLPLARIIREVINSENENFLNLFGDGPLGQHPSVTEDKLDSLVFVENLSCRNKEFQRLFFPKL